MIARWKRVTYKLLIAIMVLQPAMFSYVMAAAPLEQAAQQEASEQAVHGNVMQHGQGHAALHHHHKNQQDGSDSFNCCQTAACSYSITVTSSDITPVVVASTYEVHQPYFSNVILPTEPRPPRQLFLV